MTKSDTLTPDMVAMCKAMHDCDTAAAVALLPALTEVGQEETAAAIALLLTAGDYPTALGGLLTLLDDRLTAEGSEEVYKHCVPAKVRNGLSLGVLLAELLTERVIIVAALAEANPSK